MPVIGGGGASSVDAADVTYTPAVLTDWNSDADPGDTDQALDQLAARIDDEEAHSHAAPDAADVTYTPTVLTDWDGDADPGDVDNALDQLAERIDDVEGAAGHAAVTLDADAEVLLDLSTQEIGLDTQTANTVFAGPASGAANEPTFRALVGADILDAVYPVGAIYISVVDTSPATLFGGTWAAFGAGMVLVGINGGDADFDTVEETGGAKTVQASAQTFAGTPSTVVVNHVHPMNGPTSSSGGEIKIASDSNASGSAASGLNTDNPTGGSANYTPAGTNTAGAATSVVQPYIVVYMWKRTA